MKQILCELCENTLFGVVVEDAVEIDELENVKIIPYDDYVKILENNFSYTMFGVGHAESKCIYLCKTCKQEGSFELKSTLYGIEICE